MGKYSPPLIKNLLPFLLYIRWKPLNFCMKTREAVCFPIWIWRVHIPSPSLKHGTTECLINPLFTGDTCHNPLSANRNAISLHKSRLQFALVSHGDLFTVLSELFILKSRCAHHWSVIRAWFHVWALEAWRLLIPLLIKAGWAMAAMTNGIISIIQKEFCLKYRVTTKWKYHSHFLPLAWLPQPRPQLMK